VTADIDKGGNAAQDGKPRNVPLTNVAFKILMEHAPRAGFIFGKVDGKPHDIRVQWKRAAVAVLGEEQGRRCAPYDLRHGANFRMRSTVGGSLGGAMHMTGHARGTTNDLYMQGSEEEAKAIVEKLNKRNVELEKKLRKRR
jgi:integrase